MCFGRNTYRVGYAHHALKIRGHSRGFNDNLPSCNLIERLSGARYCRGYAIGDAFGKGQQQRAMTH